MMNNEIKKFDVVGFGISTLDYICVFDKISYSKDVNFISDIFISSGGVVPTALVAMQRLGLKTTFITNVANDWVGKKIINELHKELIDCSGVQILEKGASPLAFIQVDKEKNDRLISFFQGVSKDMKLPESYKELIKNSNVLHLDGYNTFESIKAAKYALKNKVKVSIDVNVVVDGTTELISYADYLIIPETFLFQYTKSNSIKYSISKICKEIKPEVLIVTQGAKGSVTLINNKLHRINAFNVKVKDTTGAGDAYHGAFIFGIMNKWNISDTMVFATAISAINCTYLGGREGIPSYEETIKFLKKNSIDINRLKIKYLKK